MASPSTDLPGRVLIGLLSTVFPPKLVDEVIEEAGAREQRRRLLPSRLMVYFCLACWLYMNQGYDGVLRTLVDGLRDTAAGWGQWKVPFTASISKARDRLGPEVMRLLFGRVAGPVGSPDTAGVFWRGLRLVAVDGTTLDVPDSAANTETFGRPSNTAGGGAYPQVRLVAVAECGTRAVLDAAFGPYRTAEQSLTRDLLVSLKPGMLLLADRNFLGWQLWREAAATGAELLWRARASFNLPVRRVLADGTYLSELRPARRRDGDPDTSPGHRVQHRHRRRHLGTVLPAHHPARPRHRAGRRTGRPLRPTVGTRNRPQRNQGQSAGQQRRAALPPSRRCPTRNLGDALRLPGPARPHHPSRRPGRD